MKEKKTGGKRENAGRDKIPEAEKKKQLCIYIEQKYLEDFDLKELKKELYEYIVSKNS